MAHAGIVLVPMVPRHLHRAAEPQHPLAPVLCSPVRWDELLSTVSPAQCNCRTGNNSHCVLRRRRAEGKKGDPAKALFSREEMPEQVHHRGEIPSEGRNS